MTRTTRAGHPAHHTTPTHDTGHHQNVRALTRLIHDLILINRPLTGFHRDAIHHAVTSALTTRPAPTTSQPGQRDQSDARLTRQLQLLADPTGPLWHQLHPATRSALILELT